MSFIFTGTFKTVYSHLKTCLAVIYIYLFFQFSSGKYFITSLIMPIFSGVILNRVTIIINILEFLVIPVLLIGRNFVVISINLDVE